MTSMELEKLKYPIGKYRPSNQFNEVQKEAWIAELSALPAKLKDAVSGLSDEQLDTPYRPEGWTLRQVVHHLADSHLNAYTRFKLAFTEDNPSIRPYDENLWAACPDAKKAPVSVSLNLLESLHQRWVLSLKSATLLDFERTYFHPQHQKTFNLVYLLGLYVWHGAHHLAHITETRKRHQWL